jgi:hypothetical protein
MGVVEMTTGPKALIKGVQGLAIPKQHQIENFWRERNRMHRD